MARLWQGEGGEVVVLVVVLVVVVMVVVVVVVVGLVEEGATSKYTRQQKSEVDELQVNKLLKVIQFGARTPVLLPFHHRTSRFPSTQSSPGVPHPLPSTPSSFVLPSVPHQVIKRTSLT